MQSVLKKIFTPPIFSSRRENHNASTLNKILWLVLGVNLVYISSLLIQGDFTASNIFLSIITVSGMFVSLWLLKQRKLTQAYYAILIPIWVASLFPLFLGDNTLNFIIALYFVLVIPAFSLLKRKQHTFFALLLISSVLVQVIAKELNLLPKPYFFIPINRGHISLIVIGFVGTILLFYVIQNLNKITEEAENSQKQLIESNKKLLQESKVRQQVSEAFRESEKQFRMLFSEAPVGMAVLNIDSTFIKVNPALCAMFKYSEEELMQKLPNDLIRPDLIEKTQAHIISAIMANEANIKYEQHYVCGDGSDLIGWVHVIIERDEEGRPYRFVSQVVDITARRQAELALLEERALLANTVKEKTADLQKANEALREASTRKDEFLATMSHELRTPLNVILTRTQAMQMKIYGDVTDKQHSALTGITDSSHHLLSLIKDILDVSKIASGEEHIDLTLQLINPIITEAVSSIMPIATKNNLSLHTNIEDKSFLINCDKRRIKQILTNLLSNAVKFTPAGGEISISLRGIAERSEIEIVVQDSGIGISEADQKRLFQPFTQIDSSLSRKFEGTGLGLSLVKQLAELHKGSVKLESQEGKGSKFFVYLPWTSEHAKVKEITINAY